MTISTNCVQLKAKYSQHSLFLKKHSRHYLNALYYFGSCYAYLPTNRKLDISCKLDVLHPLSTFQSQLHQKAS